MVAGALNGQGANTNLISIYLKRTWFVLFPQDVKEFLLRGASLVPEQMVLPLLVLLRRLLEIFSMRLNESALS